MKKIEAIVRRNKIQEIREALHEIDEDFFSSGMLQESEAKNGTKVSIEELYQIRTMFQGI